MKFCLTLMSKFCRDIGSIENISGRASRTKKCFWKHEKNSLDAVFWDIWLKQQAWSSASTTCHSLCSEASHMTSDIPLRNGGNGPVFVQPFRRCSVSWARNVKYSEAHLTLHGAGWDPGLTVSGMRAACWTTETISCSEPLESKDKTHDWFNLENIALQPWLINVWANQMILM